MSFNYDSTTQTLVIITASGYADATDSAVPLDQLLILHDRSGAQTPTEFHIPALKAALFEGTAIEPPRFPLPDGCKVNVQLGRIDPYDIGERPKPAGSLDAAFPWLELPGVQVLKTLKLNNSSGTPPSTSNVKHLLLGDCGCFNLDDEMLPTALETFILEYREWNDKQLNADELWGALPRGTLQTLAVVVTAYDVVEDTIFWTLDDFTKLRTLCVPAFLLREELWEAMPHSVENLAIDVFRWEHAEKVLEKMVEVVERLPNLRKLLVQGVDLAEAEEEELQKAAKENDVELTLCDMPATFIWPSPMDKDVGIDATQVYWLKKEPDHRACMMFRKELF